jgi:Domain of unknown function (DUF4145)
MSFIVADCPRCGANQITFDVTAQAFYKIEFGWRYVFEIFCICRACRRPTIFVVGLKKNFTDDNGLVSSKYPLNDFFTVDGFISAANLTKEKPPEHLPKEINAAFTEGASCLAVQCNNASATMFRLCVDLATRPLLPNTQDCTEPQPNNKTRRDLGLRLTWLFDNGKLPSNLRELAKCIREDANDGAHVGNLTKEDAEDSLDFTRALLERLFTEPKRLKLAEARRVARRSKPRRVARRSGTKSR